MDQFSDYHNYSYEFDNYSNNLNDITQTQVPNDGTDNSSLLLTSNYFISSELVLQQEEITDYSQPNNWPCNYETESYSTCFPNDDYSLKSSIQFDESYHQPVSSYTNGSYDVTQNYPASYNTNMVVPSSELEYQQIDQMITLSQNDIPNVYQPPMTDGYQPVLSNELHCEFSNSNRPYYQYNDQQPSHQYNYHMNYQQEQQPVITETLATVISTVIESPLNSYKCNETNCDKTFSTNSSLASHIKKKHGLSLYPCDECSSNFPTTYARTMHKITEHEGRKYKKCREKSTTQVAAARQPTESNTSNSLKCGICNKEFNDKNELSQHMQDIHIGSGEYPCPECSKVFYTFDMFNEHRNLHDERIPKHICKVCRKEFISIRKLKEHSIIHQERPMFRCEVCSKVFLRSQTLQYHRITCKAAYSCDKCVDSFMTEEGLARHKMLHIMNDSFTCKKCNKTFPTCQALMSHEKRHTLRMNYTCPICKESVSTRTKFQKHIRDHLERNLWCTICNKRFISLVKYGYHKAEMHSIMRPYGCILCTDEFCTRQELFMHLHNHVDANTVSNSYVCEVCGLKFSMKMTYEQHKNSHYKCNSGETETDGCNDTSDGTFNLNTFNEISKVYNGTTQIPSPRSVEASLVSTTNDEDDDFDDFFD